MAFAKKEIKKPFMLLLVVVIIQVSFVDTTNFDCKGKAFYCLNSTHFMICVDLGDGISRTVDDFLIPCPPPTICTETSKFECEYYTTTTQESIISESEDTKPITKSVVKTFWDDSASTTLIPLRYKNDDFFKSEKYINTVNITSTENNPLDKAHSTSSWKRLTSEETTIVPPNDQWAGFKAELTIPTDVKNGTEIKTHMQDKINENSNTNMFTTVFTSATKKISENLNSESTIIDQSLNTEFSPLTVTLTEGYDSYTTMPTIYFDTISTTLSESTTTAKPITVNNKISENIKVDWNLENNAEQSATPKYILFDGYSTGKKDEINTYITKNAFPTTEDVDNLNNLHTTITKQESELQIQNIEVTTNVNDEDMQFFSISESHLEVLETTQSPDLTLHSPLTTTYQLEETTKSFGFNDEVITKGFNSKKHDNEINLNLDILATNTERLSFDVSTKASDTNQPDIYFKTTSFDVNERRDSKLTTQFQDFFDKISTNQEDVTSNTNYFKNEITTELTDNELKNEIISKEIKNAKQQKSNLSIKNRDVLDTDELFTKANTISDTKDYYTFEKGDTEFTVENDATPSSLNLLFSTESRTNSYVFDNEVSIEISDALNNKTLFNPFEIMRNDYEEGFPSPIGVKTEDSTTYNYISEKKDTIFYKETTKDDTENISQVNLLENKVSSKGPDFILSRNKANKLELTNEESGTDLPLPVSFNNYEAKTTEFIVLATQRKTDNSYLTVTEVTDINDETGENNLALTKQNPTTISDDNLKSGIGEKFYSGDQLSFTDINLNTDMNIPTDKTVMLKDKSSKRPFQRKSTVFFFTAEMNTLDEQNIIENKQIDIAASVILKESDMLPTQENVTTLGSTQDYLMDKITTSDYIGTTLLPDMLGTDLTFTDEVYMTLPAINEQNNVNNNKLISTVTDEYYQNEKKDSETNSNILFKIDSVTQSTNNYSVYNLFPKHRLEEKRKELISEYDSPIIKNGSKNIQKYPPNVGNKDSLTSLYTTMNIDFVPTEVYYNKTEPINNLKDELISIHPTTANIQGTTVVYQKEDRERFKIKQDFGYNTDISRVKTPKYEYATPLSEVEEVATTQKPKLFAKHSKKIDEYSTTLGYIAPLTIKVVHSGISDLKQNSKSVDKFNITGTQNESIIESSLIVAHDIVSVKTLSDNMSIQNQHGINEHKQPEKSGKRNAFLYKKNETIPIIHKNITRHAYVTVPPVNMKAINFSCLNRHSGKYSDHSNCQRFYICIGRLLPIVGQCPVNTVFSEILKQCTHNLSHCIRNNQFQCIASGRFSDMLAKDTYYICVKRNKNYIRFKLKCQKGYYLNRTSITCMEDTVSLSLSLSKDSYSTASSSSSIDSKSVQIPNKGTKNELKCVKQGIFPDPNDCKVYYICDKISKSEFRRKKEKCDSDEVFHKRKKKCVDEESYECNM